MKKLLVLLFLVFVGCSTSQSINSTVSNEAAWAKAHSYAARHLTGYTVDEYLVKGTDYNSGLGVVFEKGKNSVTTYVDYSDETGFGDKYTQKAKNILSDIEAYINK